MVGSSGEARAADSSQRARGGERGFSAWFHTRAGAAVCIGVLAAIAAWLRFTGLDHDLPHFLNRDGLKVVLQTELMRQGVWDGAGEPRWSQYPHLLARIVSFLGQPDHEARRTLAEHIAGASSTWMQIRTVNALAGILAVPLTYALARHFLDRARAILAAGFVATSMVHIELSLDERPHVLLTTLVILVALMAMRLRRRPDVSTHALAATASGLAMGALHNGIATFLMVATAWWMRAPPRRLTRVFALAAMALLTCGWAAIFYPFAFSSKPHASPPRPGVITFWGKEFYPERLDGTGFIRMAEPLWAWDSGLFVLGLAGCAVLAVRGWSLVRSRPTALRADVAIAASFCLPYIVVFGLYRETAGRYVLPLIPFLACTAAGVVPRRLAVGAFALILVQLVPAAHMARLRARPDTVEQASEMIERLAAADEGIAVTPALDLPLFTADRSLAANASRPWRTIWSQYQSKLGSIPREGRRYEVLVDPFRGRGPDAPAITDPIQELKDRGVDWVVVAGPSDILPNVLSALHARAPRVARISPMRVDRVDNPCVPVTVTRSVWVFPPPSFRLLGATSAGPTVEIYRLP